MWNSFVLVSLELEARLSEEVHRLHHALFLAKIENIKDGDENLLLFELQVELPSEGLATRHLPMLVAQGDSHLD